MIATPEDHFHGSMSRRMVSATAVPCRPIAIPMARSRGASPTGRAGSPRSQAKRATGAPASSTGSQGCLPKEPPGYRYRLKFSRTESLLLKSVSHE